MKMRCQALIILLVSIAETGCRTFQEWNSVEIPFDSACRGGVLLFSTYVPQHDFISVISIDEPIQASFPIVSIRFNSCRGAIEVRSKSLVDDKFTFSVADANCITDISSVIKTNQFNEQTSLLPLALFAVRSARDFEYIGVFIKPEQAGQTPFRSEVEQSRRCFKAWLNNPGKTTFQSNEQ